MRCLNFEAMFNLQVYSEDVKKQNGHEMILETEPENQY